MTPPTLIPFGNDTGIVSIYPNGIIDIRVIAGQQTLSARMHIVDFTRVAETVFLHIKTSPEQPAEICNLADDIAGKIADFEQGRRR